MSSAATTGDIGEVTALFSIGIDTSIFAALDLLPAQIEAAQTAALDRAAQVMVAAKQREIARTAARPIPDREQVSAYRAQVKAGQKPRIKGGKKAIGSGGNPAWKRTGEWAEGQAVSSPSGTVRVIETTGPAAVYEARLADLPTGALGINRTNRASEEAQRKTEPQLQAVVEQEVRNALGL